METKLLWSPPADFQGQSNLTQYIKWLNDNRGLSFSSYHELWKWSVNQLEDFWSSIFEYFDISYSGSLETPLKGGKMPFYKWFSNASLNYSENIFKQAQDSTPAIIYKTENTALSQLSWKDLRLQVAALRDYLKNEAGVTKGDRVVGYLTNTPEAVISFLAVNSLGAVWSSCSPDFGLTSVIDRFNQVSPKVFIAVNGYSYGGKYYDKTDTVKEVAEALPTVDHVLVINNNDDLISDNFQDWNKIVSSGKGKLEFTHVNFNDPIWILYSSGTTGKPKAITHSQGGILLEHLKYLAFHNNVKKGDRCFWYTTTGWMMWNYIQSALLCGGTLVMYDGSPAWPEMDALWQLADEAQISHLGASAGYIVANLKAKQNPGARYDLSSLISIGSTGSPLPPEGFDWIYKSIKEDIWLTSISGGTDVCSAFVGGNPLTPVYSGEIQCRALGCDLHAFDENGTPVLEEVGEMIISKPMPSMPIYFWNDTEFHNYKSSYFEMYDGVWRHGDWVEITNRNGIKIFGRSDATLNRGGVRIGTSEIYRAIDKIEEVEDSLIICIETAEGNFYMPLFIKLAADVKFDDSLRKEINATIRKEYSPRHVPDEIIVAPDIPYTISGKKTEAPIKKILMGQPLSKAMNRDALRNPEAIDFFIEIAKNQ
ncbi:MAG: acetoacetate--CoA ligase [Bacteroidota bacterium]